MQPSPPRSTKLTLPTGQSDLGLPSELAGFSDLLHLIYAASAEPVRWPKAVAAIANEMKAMQALLFTPWLGAANGGFFYPWQVTEKDLILYGTKYAAHDVWTQSAHRKGFMREGRVAFGAELVPQVELLDSLYYREFLSPMGVAQLCTGVVFEGAPGLPGTVLSLYRGLHDDPFGPKDRELMQLLLPHLSRSLGLMHRLGAVRHQVASLRAALDRLSVGVLLLNRDLKVAYSNQSAQTVLSRGDGLLCSAQGNLTGQGFAGSKLTRFESWLAQTLGQPAEKRSAFSDTFEITRKAPQARYSMQCCTLEPSDPLFDADAAHHIVFVTDPEQLELPTHTQTQSMLGLTPAEARVALALVQTGNYNEVASDLGVSVQTVRSQAKSIYAKTQVNNKGALTRLMLSLSKASV